MTTNYMSKIKLIEGLIVAAETLGGEVIFFSFSGRLFIYIIKFYILHNFCIYSYFFYRQNPKEIRIWIYFYILFYMLCLTTWINFISIKSMVGNTNRVIYARTYLCTLLYNNSCLCKQNCSTWYISYDSRNRSWYG